MMTVSPNLDSNESSTLASLSSVSSCGDSKRLSCIGTSSSSPLTVRPNRRIGPGGSIKVISLELLYLEFLDFTFVVAPNISTSFFVPLGCLLVLSCMSLFQRISAVSKNTCSWSDGVSNRFCRDTVVKSSYRTLIDTVCPKRLRFLNRFDKRFAKYLNSSSMALPSVKSSS